MGLSNNFLKNNLVFRDTGRLMGTINPNHINLDLHCPIGWSNSQTHILKIKLHHHLPTFQLLSFLSGLS